MDQLGKSMVEMLGVLAIIGVLSAGGLSGYSLAMKKHKMNMMSDEISTIVTNISVLFGNEKDYSALGNDPEDGTQKAIQLGVFPKYMVQNDGVTVLNAYKGHVYVYAVDYAGVENGAYTIDYEGLPKETAIAYAIDKSNVNNSSMMSVYLQPEIQLLPEASSCEGIGGGVLCLLQ